MLVIFIDKLIDLDDEDSHIGQAPVFSRGDPDVKETIVDSNDDEQLGMPEDMEATDRTTCQSCQSTGDARQPSSGVCE